MRSWCSVHNMHNEGVAASCRADKPCRPQLTARKITYRIGSSSIEFARFMYLQHNVSRAEAMFRQQSRAALIPDAADDTPETCLRSGSRLSKIESQMKRAALVASTIYVQHDLICKQLGLHMFNSPSASNTCSSRLRTS